MAVMPLTGPLASWASLAAVFSEHRAPAYARLASAAAVDPEIEALGPPLLVLHALRLAALQGRARDPWIGDPDAFREDLRQLREERSTALARGLLQFTEPLRMADLLPGFCIAAARYAGRPLRLIDLGACVGLHLMPECFEIRYPKTSWSPSTAGITLDSRLDVPAELIERELPIADRLGIDLAPLSATDAGTFDYLRSFAWAGDPAREHRLQAALTAVASGAPTLLAGDVVERLPDVLNQWVSADAVTVVIDSAMSPYLSWSQSLRLGRLLEQMCCCGPLLMLRRGGAIPNSAGLPGSVRLVDLSRRDCVIYAACDFLSERMQWVGRPGLAE